MKPAGSFTHLLAWKSGHRLVLLIYKVTGKFPRDEIYGLISQMRRASVSVTSNIAEGFGRKKYPEKIQFYYYAHASLIELKNQLLVSRDVHYLGKADFKLLAYQANLTHKLLQGLLTKSKEKIWNS
jgi:four helix bundle protein